MINRTAVLLRDMDHLRGAYPIKDYVTSANDDTVTAIHQQLNDFDGVLKNKLEDYVTSNEKAEPQRLLEDQIKTVTDELNKFKSQLENLQLPALLGGKRKKRSKHHTLKKNKRMKRMKRKTQKN